MQKYGLSFDKINVIIACCKDIYSRYCIQKKITSTNNLLLSSLIEKVVHFLLSGINKLDRVFFIGKFYHLIASCSNMLRRHIAATNNFVCTGEIWWKSLSLQQNFVAATSHTNSVWFDFLQHVAATKFCCRDRDFQKNFPVHTKRFVATTCRRNMLLQLVA